MKHILILLALSLSFTSSAALYAQEEDTESAISISFDTEDKDSERAKPEEIKRRINDVIDAVADKVKNKIDREIEIDMDDVSVEDLEDLEELKREIEESDWSHVGPAIGEMVIAVIAIIFTLGLPIIILLLVLIFSSRRRKQKMELINSFIARDQPVPPELIQEFDNGKGDQLRSGLKWAIVGSAISIAFLINGNTEGAALGLIPIGLGLAKLTHWKMTTDAADKAE